MHYLYRHIRADKNEPFYIGVGTDKGTKRHYNRSREVSNRNSLWKKIVAKTEYQIEIMMESDDYDFILNKEIEFINLYGRIDLQTGTLANLTDGGKGVAKLDPVTNERRKYKMKGRVVSEETRQKLSEDRKGEKNWRFGTITSEKQKLAASIANKGQKRTLGFKHPPSFGKKISEAKLGEKHVRARKVINLETGIFYDTVTEAAWCYNINRGYLAEMISGRRVNKKKPNIKFKSFAYVDSIS